MIRLLTDRFIPVAGNTHELQTGSGPAKDWFVKVAGSINPRVAKRETSQGFYVVGSDGTAYGFNNNRSVERVLQFLEAGEKRFAEDPKTPIAAGAEPGVPQGAVPPAGTTVVRVYARIRPVPSGAHPSNENVAQDHFWITAEEVRAIAESRQIPRTLAGRLIRFHLVDNVRGEPDHWQPAEVKTAELKLTELEKSGTTRHFELSGTYSAATTNGLRGIEGAISGRFSMGQEGRMTEFKAYGEAQAWGRSTYTPNPPDGRFPIAFAFVQVDDEVSRTVPPQAIFYGRGYFEPGVR